MHGQTIANTSPQTKETTITRMPVIIKPVRTKKPITLDNKRSKNATNAPSMPPRSPVSLAEIWRKG